VSGRYLLDTNHLGAAIAPISPVRDRILSEVRKGIRFGTCIAALCELEVGIRQTARPDACRRQRDRLLTQVRIWPVELDLIDCFGAIRDELRAKGRVLSHVDVVLAALARTMRLTILTTDRDFEALPDLVAENWAPAAT
jgi:tRNA(fMet)-specific endonuclease VapC